MLLGAIALLILWLLFAALCAAAARHDLRNDTLTGLGMVLAKAHAAVLQRARYEGLEHIPRSREPGPLIVVANHTAGVDPTLIQAACPFYIRWMMMREMMLPAFEGVWEFLEVVPVSPRDALSARTALRHLKDGGVLGIFPEGGIERPAGMLMPFQAGTGMLVQRSGAKVLIFAIDGTPANASAFMSLLLPGRARVRVLGLVDYTKSGLDAAGIAKDMQDRLAAALGWPVGPGLSKEA